MGEHPGNTGRLREGIDLIHHPVDGVVSRSRRNAFIDLIKYQVEKLQIGIIFLFVVVGQSGAVTGNHKAFANGFVLVSIPEMDSRPDALF